MWGIQITGSSGVHSGFWDWGFGDSVSILGPETLDRSTLFRITD